MKKFQPELSDKERIMIMQENAAKIEDTTYQKPLDADELAARREDLCDKSILLNQKDDELKVIKDQFKIETDPLKLAVKNLLTEIKTKQATVCGLLYHMANDADGMMETYDQNGDLVNSRRLRPEEKQQTRIFQIGNAATN